MDIGHTIYVKNSAEAVALYQEVFGLSLGYNVKNDDGSFYHAELYDDKQPILAVAESAEKNSCNNVVCLGLTLADAKAVHKAFEKLAEHGTVKLTVTSLPWSPCCAEVVDRYGVWWYITAPQHQPDDTFDREEYQRKQKGMIEG